MIENKQYRFFNDDYAVSSTGDVYSFISNKKLKHNIDVDGYHRVDIHGKHYKVHKLVFECWSDNPCGEKQINHIDDDKNNNSIDNLYAGSQSENIADCIRNNHRVGNMKCLILYDKSLNKMIGFEPAFDFIKYSGHSQKNGSLSKIMKCNWFNEKYDVVFYGKGVTTIPDECKGVEWISRHSKRAA